jgi:alpha-tubulin suppressor-like RCC1 family protein
MTTVPDVSGVAHVGVSNLGTCAVLTNGSIKCWGDDRFMYFGDGQDIARHYEKVPVSVSGLSNVTDITTGKSHSCALINDGTVKCWGDNDNGELGDNTTRRLRSTPISVSGLSGVSEVTAGNGFTCARLSDGTAKCWGSYGPFLSPEGERDFTKRLTPVSVSDLTGASQISSMGGQTCAVISGNAVKCWGWNDHGKLGSTDTYPRLTPVQAGE